LEKYISRVRKVTVSKMRFKKWPIFKSLKMRKKIMKDEKKKPRRELAKNREAVRKEAKKRKLKKIKIIQSELGGMKKKITQKRIQVKTAAKKAGRKFCLCFFILGLI
jgi:hypothetical protein